jgi:hypothetical protein
LFYFSTYSFSLYILLLTSIRLLSLKIFTYSLPPLFLVIFLILLFLLLLMIFCSLILLGLIVNLLLLILPSLPATLLPAPPPAFLLRLLNIHSTSSYPSFPASLFHLIIFPTYSRVLMFVFSPNILLYITFVTYFVVIFSFKPRCSIIFSPPYFKSCLQNCLLRVHYRHNRYVQFVLIKWKLDFRSHRIPLRLTTNKIP